MQRLLVVARQHGDRLLGEDRPGIDLERGDVDRARRVVNIRRVFTDGQVKLTGKQKIWGSFNYNWRHRFQRGAATFPPFPGWPINPVKNQDVGGPQVRMAHAWTISDRSLNEFQIG